MKIHSSVFRSFEVYRRTDGRSDYNSHDEGIGKRLRRERGGGKCEQMQTIFLSPVLLSILSI